MLVYSIYIANYAIILLIILIVLIFADLCRYKVLVTEGEEFILMVRDVRLEDGGLYQCQVSGPQHTSLTRTVALIVIGRTLDCGPHCHR